MKNTSDYLVTVDLTAISCGPADGVGSEREETAYWLSKSPDDRIAALELLRQRFYGHDPATERLQRVLDIVKSTPG